MGHNWMDTGATFPTTVRQRNGGPWLDCMRWGWSLTSEREDFDINEIWERLKAAHKSQDVVITLGTGRISAEEEEVMGLIGEHDYAVEDIETTDNNRNLLIKNPWCDGPPMSGTGWTTPPYSQASSADSAIQPRSTSTLWVAFEDVAQHFESMYLNWNPALFANRIDRHFTWQPLANQYSTSLLKNPQYSLSSASGGAVWVLISRHFADGELEIAGSRRDSMAAVARQLGFMSILVFRNRGKRVQISGGEMYRGPYVDSHQTLARLDANPGEQYTIVVDHHELPLSHYSFTMSLFSHHPVRLLDATETMSHFQQKIGAWTRRTAGGNPSCSAYFQNPQYKLSINQASPVSILLSADVEDLHVHVDLVWGRGDRVMSLRGKDLVASSGEYRRGCAVADVDILEPGTYTLVCSTFDAGQLAGYAIRVASMASTSLHDVPADGAGRLLTKLPRFRLMEGHERVRLSIGVARLTRANISVRSLTETQPGAKRHPPSSLMVRVSAAYGSGAEREVKAVSGNGEFQDPAGTIRLTDFDVEPARAKEVGFWILVESVGPHDVTWDIDAEIFSDSPVQIGIWETTELG